jgi:hypothetical protein
MARYAPPAILIYGHDTMLLETRRMVLENDGFHTWTAENSMDVAEAITSDRIEVLILCHSLTFEECQQAHFLGCSQWPLWVPEILAR